MENNRKLNLDVFGSIEKLRGMLKDFETVKKYYKMFFRGKSFDFETFRQYYPDDDAFNIDWIASARYDKLLVKQYREEEKLTIIFFIDVGDNMVSGSGEKLKCECAAEIALALAFLAINDNHRIGFVLYNEGIKAVYPPKGGKRSFFSFLDILSNGSTYGGGSNLEKALDVIPSLPNYTSPVAVIISDFVKFNEGMKKNLSLLNISFEAISIMVRDPIDDSLPGISGEFLIEDIDSGRQISFDPRLAGKIYKKSMQAQKALVQKVFQSAGVDLLEVKVNEEYMLTLGRFMHTRLSRGGLFK